MSVPDEIVTEPVLSAGDPAPATLLRPDGASPFVVVCDHAGRAVPAGLADLGLSHAELDRHIGWDIGAGALSLALGARLDATTITQTYSRLVIDCNRPPGTETSIAAISDGTAIPGNAGLNSDQVWAREAEIFWPYQTLIRDTLDARAAQHRRSVLLAVHSFTPVFRGVSRPWHIGLLFDRDPSLAWPLGDLLRHEPGLMVADNEPYALDQETDFTIPVHGEQRGITSLELEIRQDLIADATGVAEWAARLARLLPLALARALPGPPVID